MESLNRNIWLVIQTYLKNEKWNLVMEDLIENTDITEKGEYPLARSMLMNGTIQNNIYMNDMWKTSAVQLDDLVHRIREVYKYNKKFMKMIKDHKFGDPYDRFYEYYKN